jgi:hypothetical protein
MTADEIIKQAVDKFLPWKLPKNFQPDSFITFDGSKHDTWGGYPNSWPTGTNLFTSEQAKSMFEHCLSAALTAQADELEAQHNAKDGAYWERNNLVALLSKVFPAGKKKTAIEGWPDDWRGCVYIDLPTGQASWHYHDSQAHLFDHLPEYQGEWDGHTTGEKYERIAGYQATAQADRVKELDAPMGQEPFEYLWEPDGTFNIGQERQLSTNTGPCIGWKITPLYLAAGAQPKENT